MMVPQQKKDPVAIGYASEESSSVSSCEEISLPQQSSHREHTESSTALPMTRNQTGSLLLIGASFLAGVLVCFLVYSKETSYSIPRKAALDFGIERKNEATLITLAIFLLAAHVANRFLLRCAVLLREAFGASTDLALDHSSIKQSITKRYMGPAHQLLKTFPYEQDFTCGMDASQEDGCNTGTKCLVARDETDGDEGEDLEGITLEGLREELRVIDELLEGKSFAQADRPHLMSTLRLLKGDLMVLGSSKEIAYLVTSISYLLECVPTDEIEEIWKHTRTRLERIVTVNQIIFK